MRQAEGNRVPIRLTGRFIAAAVVCPPRAANLGLAGGRTGQTKVIEMKIEKLLGAALGAVMVAGVPAVAFAQSADAPPTIDTNGDGKPDAWDTNGDGKADAWDTNGDGKPDAVDADGDGKPDAQ